MFFQSRFLDLLFLNLFKIFLKNDRFGDPLQNPMGAKMAPKSTKWRQKIENVRYQTWIFSGLFSNPVFTKP